MSKAKVGVSMLYCLSEPFDRMVKRLSTQDTPYIEILDEGTHDLNRTRITQLKEAAKSYSLEYSLHAPFADINIASPIKPMLNASLKRLKQSLHNASAIDAKLWVFHPGQRTGIGQFYPGADFKQTCQSIQELYREAEELGVNIALENLPAKYWFLMNSPQEFLRMYRETNLPIGITLDLGHANLEGQIQPFFDLVADKIIHIHASDNDGSDDQHLGVGEGKIDYEWLTGTLKKIGYNKTIIVESITNIPQSLQKLKQLLL
ncbi:MAG: sugar phosphate isomerase/epimerase [Candidatus Bathyarchaeota archaeon]|nr:sugar phosphate isomerase/epimerase [Candidatus Bathyarchaeota archaeon]